MDRINSTGTVLDANGHRIRIQKNLSTGTNGTELDFDYDNVFQEEVVGGLIEWAGLTPDEANNRQVQAALLKMLGGAAINVQEFLSSSVYTPFTGANWGRITLIGGGAGGGAAPGIGANTPGYGVAGGGGGAGGSLVWFGPIALLAGAIITIGSAGLGGVAGNNSGASGGQTSFYKAGVLQLIANGGNGGASANALDLTIGCPGGGGGSAGAPLMTIGKLRRFGKGEDGNPGLWFAGTGGSLISGRGGTSFFGGGGSSVANSAGQASSTYGAAGSGASVATSDNTAATGFAGGNGETGYVMIEEIP